MTAAELSQSGLKASYGQSMSLRLEARVDAGLLANACIVSTAVRSTLSGNARMAEFV